MKFIEAPTDEFPEGSECPVHKRQHNSHGWYVCVEEDYLSAPISSNVDYLKNFFKHVDQSHFHMLMVDHHETLASKRREVENMREIVLAMVEVGVENGYLTDEEVARYTDD